MFCPESLASPFRQEAVQYCTSSAVGHATWPYDWSCGISAWQAHPSGCLLCHSKWTCTYVNAILPGSTEEDRTRYLFSKLFCRLNQTSPLHELLCDLPVMMVKEKTVAQVQRGNFLHLIRRQLEIE